MKNEAGPPHTPPPAVRDQDAEQEFDGVYVAHWEIARFCVVTGRRFFGLRPRVERWHIPGFPAGFTLPTARKRDNPSAAYRMKVSGRLGPPGQFGHRGICCRELRVSRVLSCQETDAPGPLW